jgi:hypothetical protein
MDRVSAAAPAPRWLLVTSGFLAFTVPLLLAAAQLHGAPRWDEDVAVVRALGQVQVGAEGVASSALSGLTALLPLGNRLMRAALVSTLASGLCAWLLYGLALRSLAPRSPAAASDVGLALGAALLPALAPLFQVEATRVGGASLGVLLVLLVLRALREVRLNAVLLGVLLGLALTERRDAALCAGALIALACVLRPERISVRQGLLLLSAALAIAAVTLLPSLWIRDGRGFSLGLSLGLPLGADGQLEQGPLAQVGPLFSLLALFGALSALWQREQRAVAMPWLVLLALGLLTSGAVARLCGVAALAHLSVLGMRTVLTLLRRSQLPLQGVAVQLVFLVAFCALLLVAEDGRRTLLARSVSGARSWTNEAFERLPTDALLLSDSSSIAWRLWAARVLEGTRPDVTLVPSPLLGHGTLARELLNEEPRLGGLIRDYAIAGTASELSLSELADARPLKVELDMDWSRRLLAHLSPDGLWSDVAPHALGRSDRAQGYEGVQSAFRVVLRHAKTERGTDFATFERVYQDLYHHALISATLGDKALASRMLRKLSRLKPDDPDCRALRASLRRGSKGAASARALLD